MYKGGYNNWLNRFLRYCSHCSCCKFELVVVHVDVHSMHFETSNMAKYNNDSNFHFANVSDDTPKVCIIKACQV